METPTISITKPPEDLVKFTKDKKINTSRLVRVALQGLKEKGEVTLTLKDVQR